MAQSDEAKYLDNLLLGMKKVVDGINPYQIGQDNPDTSISHGG